MINQLYIIRVFIIKKKIIGFLVVVQWDQQCFWSAGTQVQSPARNSGLRKRCCHSCTIGHNCGSDLSHGLGTPYAMGWPKKKKKKKEREVDHRVGKQACFNKSSPESWGQHKQKKCHTDKLKPSHCTQPESEPSENTGLFYDVGWSKKRRKKIAYSWWESEKEEMQLINSKNV